MAEEYAPAIAKHEEDLEVAKLSVNDEKLCPKNEVNHIPETSTSPKKTDGNTSYVILENRILIC